MLGLLIHSVNNYRKPTKCQALWKSLGCEADGQVLILLGYQCHSLGLRGGRNGVVKAIKFCRLLNPNLIFTSHQQSPVGNLVSLCELATYL